jgi:hypothetical protein
MRVLRVLASAIFVSGLLALPTSAQHAGSHGGGGFSAHPAPAFHSSAPISRPAFTPAARFSASGYPHPPAPWHGGRPGYGPNYHGPRVYGYSGVGAIGWVGPGYLSYGDSGPYADSSDTDQDNPIADDELASAPYPYVDQPPPDAPQQGSAPQAYAPTPYNGPVAPDPSQYQPPQQQPPQRAIHRVAAEPLPEEDALTILFKDGRSPLQVHNYMLTTTMLYVRDQQHRDIPLNDIDIAATQKANQNTDINFKVPGTK